MTADKIIDLAKVYIGTVESPANSNNVIFNTHYYGKPVSGKDFAWCCSFVWDIFRMAGASSLFYDGKKTAYCPAVQTWGRTNKLTVDKTKGKKGDIVLFDWNANGYADHIGFILENKGNGTYTTIEGNTSLTSNDNGGKVMQRTRKISDICMIIRPKYVEQVEEQNKILAPGIQLLLKNAPLYISSYSKNAARKANGTYFLYDAKEVNGRYRITTLQEYAKKSPAFMYVTGWVNKGDI